MEDPGEMHSEDDKALSDKNKKRTVKTRFQVEALENVYDEHKYPTESMKSQVAQRTGLTEKQISTWFCHRRLKDKKLFEGEPYANVKQDHSSGVIQDLGSGHRQDSFGSTKQGGDAIYHDPIEVQSRRFTGQELPAAYLTNERAGHYDRNHYLMDHTSSRSSSPPLNMNFKRDPVDMATSNYDSQNFQRDVWGGQTSSGPSGYLKVKERVENVAIIAIKRKLGRYYRADGPPLGIEFDLLPKGAFKSLVGDQVNEPCYAGEDVLRHSSDVPKIHQEYPSEPFHVEEHNLPRPEEIYRSRKQSIYGKGHFYNSHKRLKDTDLERKYNKMIRGSEYSESFFHQKPEQKYSSSKHSSIDVHEGSAGGMAIYGSRDYYEMRPTHSSIDVHEGSARGMAIYGSRDNYEMSPTHGIGGFRTGSAASQHHSQPYVAEINQEQADPYPYIGHDRRRRVARLDRFLANSSATTSNDYETDDSEDKRLSRKLLKVDNLYGAGRKLNDDRDSGQLKMSRKNVMPRVRDDHLQQDYVGRVSRVEMP